MLLIINTGETIHTSTERKKRTDLGMRWEKVALGQTWTSLDGETGFTLDGDQPGLVADSLETIQFRSVRADHPIQ